MFGDLVAGRRLHPLKTTVGVRLRWCRAGPRMNHHLLQKAVNPSVFFANQSSQCCVEPPQSLFHIFDFSAQQALFFYPLCSSVQVCSVGFQRLLKPRCALAAYQNRRSHCEHQLGSLYLKKKKKIVPDLGGGSRADG